MRVKLRAASGAKRAVTPGAISSREITGDPNPVGSMGARAGSEVYATVISGQPAMNVGRYVPPPKNPIWTPIPLGIRPTKPCGGC